MTTTQIDALPEPQRGTVLAALNESILLQLSQELQSVLSPSDLIVFEELIGQDTEQAAAQLSDFLRSKVPDLDVRIARIRDAKQLELSAGIVAVQRRLQERLASQSR